MPDWEALAAAVCERRTQLRLSQEGVARAGGPSVKTIYAIEQAAEARLRPSTLRRLDQALQWPSGTGERILAGAIVAECAAEDETVAEATASPCACVVGSPAWIERELATERRIAAITEVFRGEVQRLITLVEAARSPGDRP